MQYVYYFVPADSVRPSNLVRESQGTLNCTEVERLDLGHALRDRLIVPDQTIAVNMVGPDGIEGVLLYPRSNNRDDFPRMKFYPDEQQWHDCGDWWIVLEDDGMEGGQIDPAYFIKSNARAGYVVEDSHGQKWGVPILRTSDRDAIPKKMAFGFKGGFETSMRAKDESLWNLSGILADHVSGRKPMDQRTATESILKVIATNYWIGEKEMVLLESLGRSPLESDFLATVAIACNDRQLEEEFEQKKTEHRPALKLTS